MPASRGAYSKLICHHCRARKIRCQLENDVIAPSNGIPLPTRQACQRCQSKNLDCIVESTTLGRPTKKRPLVQVSPASSTTVTGEGHNVNVQDLILTKPLGGGSSQSDAATVFEALICPINLLSLLSEKSQFGSKLDFITESESDANPTKLIDDGLAALLDRCLVWHKLYCPYIPSLASLRNELISHHGRSSDRLSTTLLFALLCSLALDVPSAPSALQSQLKPWLDRLIFQHGQKVLFSLPCHRHTVLAFELIAEYRPLAMVETHFAAGQSLKGNLYISLAKFVAKQLHLDDALTGLRDDLEGMEASSVQQSVLDCLQWWNIVVAENELDRLGLTPALDAIMPGATLDSPTELLRSIITDNRMSIPVNFLYYRLAAMMDFLQVMPKVVSGWKNLSTLAELIQEHTSTCDRRKLEFNASISNTNNGSDAFAAIQAFEMHLNRHHNNILGLALFYAVMSGTCVSASQPLDPAKAVQVSDHIIDCLRSQDATDANRHSVRIFLEQHGENRSEQLEKVLTDFISIADVSIQGVDFVGPARHTAAELLFNAKVIVEDDAARLKGWGGMHQRVDTQLILFQECARRLEAMATGANEPDAVAKGSVHALGAKLIRDLHRIVVGWKRKLAETERLRNVPEAPPAEGSSLIGDTGVRLDDLAGATVWDDLARDDFFMDWKDWPQMDTCDFAQIFPTGVEESNFGTM